VDINADGDWIATYSKSTFVGHRTSSSSKMVSYDRRTVPGSVAINDRGDWIAGYSKSTFVGFKRSTSSKMVTYSDAAPARSAVAINPSGDWIVNYSKSTFVGHRTSSSSKMVSYSRRTVAGGDDASRFHRGDRIFRTSSAAPGASGATRSFAPLHCRMPWQGAPCRRAGGIAASAYSGLPRSA
jgi:hypothetical protein